LVFLRFYIFCITCCLVVIPMKSIVRKDSFPKWLYIFCLVFSRMITIMLSKAVCSAVLPRIATHIAHIRMSLNVVYAKLCSQQAGCNSVPGKCPSLSSRQHYLHASHVSLRRLIAKVAYRTRRIRRARREGRRSWSDCCTVQIGRGEQ